jgi:hypothetical protein
MRPCATCVAAMLDQRLDDRLVGWWVGCLNIKAARSEAFFQRNVGLCKHETWSGLGAGSQCGVLHFSISMALSTAGGELERQRGSNPVKTKKKKMGHLSRHAITRMRHESVSIARAYETSRVALEHGGDDCGGSPPDSLEKIPPCHEAARNAELHLKALFH